MGINETCDDCIKTIKDINALIERDEKKIIGQTATVKTVFGYMKKHPIVNIGTTAKSVGLSYNTVASALNKLAELEIVREKTTAARNRVYEYSSYLDILKAGT